MQKNITQLQMTLALLTGVYKGFTTEQAMLYSKFLTDIPVDLVTSAINSLIQKSKYAPTIAEIRTEAETIYRAATKTEIPSPADAWEEALNAVAHYGYYGKPKFSHPFIELAMKRFGFKELCMQEPKTIGVARRQFMDIYSQVVNQQKERKRVNAIIGKNPALQNLVNQAADKMKLEAGKEGTNEQC